MNTQADTSHNPDEPSAKPERDPDQTHSYTKLEERIAKLGSERTGVASKLLYAWESQREVMDERYRRQNRLMGGLFTLFAVIFALVLFLQYREAKNQQARIFTEGWELRRERAQVPFRERFAKQILERLDQVNTHLGVIASSLKRPDEDGEQSARVPAVTEQGVREEPEVADASKVQLLAAEQRHLSQELKSLHSAFETLERRVAEPPTASGASPAPEAEAAAKDLQVAESRVAGGAKTEDGDGRARRKSDTGGSGSDEILVSPKRRYALQLIGFFSPKSLDKFVTHEQLPARVYSIRETYKGRPWYTLIHSLHEDKAAAAAALSRLPADLIALNPWIRPLPAATRLQIIEVNREPN